MIDATGRDDAPSVPHEPPVPAAKRGGVARSYLPVTWPPPVAWTRRVVVGLIVAAIIVGFAGRHGGAVLASFGLAFAALAVGLLSVPDGDPEVD